MPEVPPRERESKSLAKITKPRERAGRPPACAVCRCAAWWNGWRVIYPMVAAITAATTERWELPVPRAKCSRCRHGFTCYPDGIYPRRQYQLDVVAETAAAVALGEASGAEVARTSRAAPTSVRRWLGWIATLASAGDLLAIASRIDPDVPVAGGLLPADRGEGSVRARAAAVLAALEHIGAALVRRGLTLAARTGLGRVLGWQHAVHGDVYGLVAGVRHLSPGMAIGGSGGRA